jgi:hypothetical protein
MNESPDTMPRQKGGPVDELFIDLLRRLVIEAPLRSIHFE